MRLKSQNMRFRSQLPSVHMPDVLLFALCILCLGCFQGCFGTEAVRIKVGVNSKIDMKEYKTIAVMDFVDSRSNSLTNDGKTLARMIRKQLGNSKELNVLDEKGMNLNLREVIDKDKIENPEILVSIANQLGADALIVSTFEFHQLNQPMPYIVEQYSPRTGRYTPETRTYVRRTQRLSFHARLIDGKTGETVFDYAPRIEERPESRRAWGMPLSGESKSNRTGLRGMAARPVATFVLSLVPHYEYERRILVR